jgi:hypothetical protein
MIQKILLIKAALRIQAALHRVQVSQLLREQEEQAAQAHREAAHHKVLL